MHNYRVRVTKDTLVFSAGHFITFNGDVCERLHGHNWRVQGEIAGPLDENHYVFDFIALRDTLQQLVAQLDHHMLLPMLHPLIQVTTTAHEVEARFRERRWVFPREDCVLLPVANTTAELIAHWMLEQLVPVIQRQPGQHVTLAAIEVEENFGQWARCERTFP